MKMFNASLERFKFQCDSIVFRFEPRSAIEVPDRLVEFVYNAHKHYGVFPIYPSMTQDDIKKAHREAMKSYLYGRIRDRILNYQSMVDDYKKRGVTIEKDARFERALRWDKEIRTYLNIEAPLEEELSFLTHEERLGVGIDDERIQHIPQNLFDANTILQANGLPTHTNEQPEKTAEVKKAPRKLKIDDISPDELR